MTKKNTSGLGKLGETLAQKYLEDNKYIILNSNYKNASGRCLGEIDVIAREGEDIVFVEVKTRKIMPNYFSLPEENISRSKLYKLNKIAQVYLKNNNLLSSSFRFDAISIIYDELNKKAQIRHLKNIFI